jgi:predicted HicB family RNase H-like nuclease
MERRLFFMNLTPKKRQTKVLSIRFGSFLEMQELSQEKTMTTTLLTYKGYKGHFEVDVEAKIIFGRVLDIRDVITFKGKTIEEAEQAFKDSVDDYLEFCQEIGEKPNKPFSGKLPFRTTPEVHRQIYIAAKKAGKSINAWMEEAVVERASEEVRAIQKDSQSVTRSTHQHESSKEIAHA